jgi:hypothetical protein
MQARKRSEQRKEVEEMERDEPKEQVVKEAGPSSGSGKQYQQR